MRLNILVALTALLLFGAPFVTSSEIAGASLALVRDAAIIVVCLIFLLRPRTGSFAALRVVPRWLLALAAVAGYVLMSTMLSPFGQGGIAITIRLIALVLVAFTALQLKSSPQSDLRVLAAWFVAYFVVSFASMLWIDGYLEGVLGRHYTKFVALSAFSVSFAAIMSGARQRLTIACAGSAILAGLLCLQRGFIISAIVAATFVLLAASTRASRRAFVLCLSVAVCATVWLFFGDRIIDYAFYEGIGPARLLSALGDGTFSLDMVRTRGRLSLVTAIIADSQLTLLGHGAGWTKSLVGNEFGAGKEPHNDVLMMVYDYGFAGAICFLIFLWTFVARARVLARSRCNAGAPFALGAGGIAVACFVWMFFSNVLIYSMAGMVFSVLLLARAEVFSRAQSGGFYSV